MSEPDETPKELFARCEANARVASRKTYQLGLSLLAGYLVFPDHLFESEPPKDLASSGDMGDLDVNFQRTIDQASRYRDLVHWLKEYPGREQRWLLLALWLKQEGISEPMDFLPPQVYKKLTREKLAKLRFSIKDFQHYYRVEAWKPYFERLLADRRAKKNLVEAGYHERAIRAALKTRAATPAACEWLASHRFGDAPTIRNAHSRISRKYQTSQN